MHRIERWIENTQEWFERLDPVRQTAWTLAVWILLFIIGIIACNATTGMKLTKPSPTPYVIIITATPGCDVERGTQ